MKLVLLSVFLLLQTPVKVVTGRVSVEGGAPIPSSLTLPLTIMSGAAPIPGVSTGPNRSLLIRPHIDGTFRLQMPPGEYRVSAPTRLPPGYTLRSMMYGGGDLLGNPLKISSGDSAELVINLATNGPAPTVSVSGRVTGIAPGDKVQRISLREPSGGEISAALETTVGADGSFTFPNVLPGNYIVYMRLRTQTPVTVGNQNVTGLIVAWPQDILVSGHVILEGAQTAMPAIAVEGNGKLASMSPRGTFIVSLANGENSVSVRNIPAAYRLKSITYGDVDLQKEPLKLDGPAIWDIIIRLAPNN